MTDGNVTLPLHTKQTEALMLAIMRLEGVIKTRQDSVQASLHHVQQNVSLAQEDHDAASTQCLGPLARRECVVECLTRALEFRAHHELLHTTYISTPITHTSRAECFPPAVVLVQVRHNHAATNKSSAQADYEQALVLLNISDTDTQWIRPVIISRIFEWAVVVCVTNIFCLSVLASILV